MTRNRWLVLVVVAAVAAVLAIRAGQESTRYRSLATRIDQVVAPVQITDCTALAAERPLVILALGQSNAGNHGAQARTDDPPVALVTPAGCTRADDPLPGGTGREGSIWRRLPRLLSRTATDRPVVMAVLAVDATEIRDWTDVDSPLRERLSSLIRAMASQNLPPRLVAWQQGEADTRRGTRADDYAAALQRLADILSEAGSKAPIMIAKSTLCRSGPSPEIRASIDRLIGRDSRFLPGPDTDALNDAALRPDGCHLGGPGLEAAARLWADAIRAQAL